MGTECGANDHDGLVVNWSVEQVGFWVATSGLLGTVVAKRLALVEALRSAFVDSEIDGDELAAMRPKMARMLVKQAAIGAEGIAEKLLKHRDKLLDDEHAALQSAADINIIGPTTLQTNSIYSNEGVLCPEHHGQCTNAAITSAARTDKSSSKLTKKGGKKNQHTDMQIAATTTDPTGHIEPAACKITEPDKDPEPATDEKPPSVPAPRKRQRKAVERQTAEKMKATQLRQTLSTLGELEIGIQLKSEMVETYVQMVDSGRVTAEAAAAAAAEAIEHPEVAISEWRCFNCGYIHSSVMPHTTRGWQRRGFCARPSCQRVRGSESPSMSPSTTAAAGLAKSNAVGRAVSAAERKIIGAVISGKNRKGEMQKLLAKISRQESDTGTNPRSRQLVCTLTKHLNGDGFFIQLDDECVVKGFATAGTAAYRAGVRPGFKLLQVNTQTIDGSREEAVRILQAIPSASEAKFMFQKTPVQAESIPKSQEVDSIATSMTGTVDSRELLLCDDSNIPESFPSTATGTNDSQHIESRISSGDNMQPSDPSGTPKSKMQNSSTAKPSETAGEEHDGRVVAQKFSLAGRLKALKSAGATAESKTTNSSDDASPKNSSANLPSKNVVSSSTDVNDVAYTATHDKWAGRLKLIAGGQFKLSGKKKREKGEWKITRTGHLVLSWSRWPAEKLMTSDGGRTFHCASNYKFDLELDPSTTVPGWLQCPSAPAAVDRTANSDTNKQEHRDFVTKSPRQNRLPLWVASVSSATSAGDPERADGPNMADDRTSSGIKDVTAKVQETVASDKIPAPDKFSKSVQHQMPAVGEVVLGQFKAGGPFKPCTVINTIPSHANGEHVFVQFDGYDDHVPLPLERIRPVAICARSNSESSQRIIGNCDGDCGKENTTSLRKKRKRSKGEGHKGSDGAKKQAINSADRIPGKLWVGGLGPKVTADTLTKVFGAVAKVAEAKIIYNGSKSTMDRVSRGYGFVTFEDANLEVAIMAHKQFHGAKLDGAIDGTMKVNFVRKESAVESKSTQKSHLQKPEPATAKNVALCMFFGSGRCNKGSSCPYRHDASAAAALAEQICKFHVTESCQRGAECPFSHDMMRVPCRHFFKAGQVCRNGKNCRFSHDRATVSPAEWELLLQATKAAKQASGQPAAATAALGDELGKIYAEAAAIRAETAAIELEQDENDNDNADPSKLVHVPAEHYGLLVGKGGATIERLRAASGAFMVLESDSDWKQRGQPPTRKLRVAGSAAQCERAQQLIAELLVEHTAAPWEKVDADRNSAATVSAVSPWRQATLPSLPLAPATSTTVENSSSQAELNASAPWRRVALPTLPLSFPPSTASASDSSATRTETNVAVQAKSLVADHTVRTGEAELHAPVIEKDQAETESVKTEEQDEDSWW
eukprot:SAG31_NODE_1717_length_7457_cov_4.893177_1_plen_1392_part_00